MPRRVDIRRRLKPAIVPSKQVWPAHPTPITVSLDLSTPSSDFSSVEMRIAERIQWDIVSQFRVPPAFLRPEDIDYMTRALGQYENAPPTLTVDSLSQTLEQTRLVPDPAVPDRELRWAYANPDPQWTFFWGGPLNNIVPLVGHGFATDPDDPVTG